MTIIGGNLERKEIGLSIGVSGTHDRTKINKDTGYLELVDIDVDGQGKPIYVEQGSWTSDVIDLGDNFQAFEKVFTNSISTGASSFAVLTRVSSNNYEWSDWTPIAEDGTIQSNTKQYIQVRIDLFAGFVTDVFLIANSDFEKNEFVEEKEIRAGSYITPTLTSNTSSPLGFAFSTVATSGNTYDAWKVFDKANISHFQTAVNQHSTGAVGFIFNSNAFSISQYLVRSVPVLASLNITVKSWFLEGSNNTTNGTDGTWELLDSQINQTWTGINQDKIFTISKTNEYKAFRLRWTANSGNASYTGIGELDFFTPAQTALQLKRDYNYDMTVDESWTEIGSLHRKSVTRNEWLKIDRLDVKSKEVIPANTNLVGVMNANSNDRVSIVSSTIYSAGYEAYKAFNGVNGAGTNSALLTGISGFIGVIFNNKRPLGKYRIGYASIQSNNAVPKSWILYGSNDTTDGTNGTWTEIDKVENQTWADGATGFRDFDIENKYGLVQYKAYKIAHSSNQGYVTYTAYSEIEFISPSYNVIESKEVK